MSKSPDTDGRQALAPISETIRMALHRHLPAARLENFSTHARLNADLGLDSIMLMELLVSLELENGLRISEDAFIGENLETVRDLARLLAEGHHEVPA
ncbi:MULTISPECIES: acyl carrier protein [Marinobacter]|uniref:acyl carrier protein n=1 Tax=Marinobacter TaxID=2742 RepID=UPI001CDA4390|nr:MULTISPECIES: phosphopantetheine-binding protein [Marinobacter]